MDKLRNNPGALAFFVAVFMNAFVDLGHKIVIQNTVFKLYTGSYQIFLTACVNALILLPFILLLCPAGYLSDRFRKTRVMRVSAWAGVIGTCFITLCYYLGWFWLAFAMTFLLAAQSAIYSPAKYGFIKEYFGKAKLGEVNGIVAALSIAAILAGTLAFSIGFESLFPAAATTEAEILRGVAPVGWFLIGSSVLEFIALYRIPLGTMPVAEYAFPWKKFLTGTQVLEDIAPLKHSRAIRLSVIGLAVFWAVGQVMLAAFPAFLKEEMGITNTIVVQAVLACSGIGIVLGSILAGRFSRNYIETGLLPIGAVGMALGLLLLPYTESVWAAGLLFLFIGMMGGIFIVPLNALIQFFAAEKELGKTLAASNWVQNLNMLFFLLVTALFSFQGWTSKALLQLVAMVTLIGSIYTVWQLPQSLTRFMLTLLVTRFYRIKVLGMKNIPAHGGVLLLGNHVSWIDWAVVQIASPRPVRFVMANNIYQRWYLKWFFELFACIPLQAGAASRSSLEQVAEVLQRGEVVCLFPEGVISRNGHLAEFRKGYELTCELVDDTVCIVPFYLRGLWGSRFSRSQQHLKQQSGSGLSRDIIVGFGAPLAKTTKAEELKQQVQTLSINSWHEYITTLPAIGELWIETCRKAGNPTVLIEDTTGTTMRAKAALAASILLSRRISNREQNIGILLPSSSGCMLINMAALLAGKTVVNLNFTASETVLLASLQQAGITTVYTSARFLKKLEARGFAVAALQQQVQLLMLEDLHSALPAFTKALTVSACWLLPASILKWLFCKTRKLDDPAAILFSSGSEGNPKGVVLSHRNILSNVKQVTEMLNLSDRDVMLANLPPFHAFGLTVTQFLPLLGRVPVVCHADPTDVFGAAKAIATQQVTVLFGTSTFFRLYTRNNRIHPLMLQSLRLLVAGAEKLQPQIRSEFKLKFNKDILEGYGATETAPVASVNLPDALSPEDWKVQQGNKTGSVGMPVPGTALRIVDPETFAPLPVGEAGMVLISGPQVMTGYLDNMEQTVKVIRELDGMRWYVTGDKGYLDKDGFLFIQDRYARFAKIGGEMISLGAVEERIRQVLDSPDHELVLVAVPDEKKGERLVLLSTAALDFSALTAALLAAGLTALALPAEWKQVSTIPTLGSGKVDFKSAKTIALQADLTSPSTSPAPPKIN